MENGTFINNTILYSISTEDVSNRELKIEDPVNAMELIQQNYLPDDGILVEIFPTGEITEQMVKLD